MRVVIYVEGGIVQAVFSDNPNISVKLLDFDNAEAEGTLPEATKELEAAYAELKEVSFELRPMYPM